MYVRGTLLRVLEAGFASCFEPDFWGESSESSCFFTWAEPLGVFMAGVGAKMGGEGETVRVIYKAWSRSHSLGVMKARGETDKGIASDVQTNPNSPSLNRHTVLGYRVVSWSCPPS